MPTQASTQMQEKILTVILLLATAFICADLLYQTSFATLTYSEFRAAVAQGEIASASLGPSYITGTLAEESAGFRVQRVDDAELIPALQQAGVTYQAATGWRPLVYGLLFPGLALGAVLFFVVRSVNNPLRRFGSRAQALIVEKPSVRFDDVAGCEEAKKEMTEVVDFMTRPEKYEQMGANLPKGVLLTGPPGTGKTLLARAVAGEAHLPFFSLSGSEFVEMYVGVGAARVRGLFEKARANAPCIVFVDEIDALGKQRGRQGESSDEREQTLNQLLVELDGFGTDSGILLIAATNRPDVIDPALLRPGRFDRQIAVDAPDRKGRLAILKVHARRKRLAADVNLDELASITPGMSGADLANLLNEAALLAASEDRADIYQVHLREAMEKVLTGPIKSNRLLEPGLKKRVAYHEAGHALVAEYCRTADPVHKISIVPRGKAALGFTLQLPAQDAYLMTETELWDRLRVLLGGRAAESLIYDEVSTGAENDLERCTQMARRMAAHFGMGASTGLLHAGQDCQNCSPETLGRIDSEAQSILKEAFAQACAMLAEHRDELELVAERLLEKETLESDDFQQLLQEKVA